MKIARTSSYVEFSGGLEEKMSKKKIMVHSEKQMHKTEKKRKMYPVDDEEDTVKKIVIPHISSQDNQQEDSSSENQNSFSLELKELVGLKSRSKVQKKRQQTNNQEKIAKIQNTLLKDITLITPFRIRASQFTEQLKIFRFEKIKKNIFGESEERIDKCKYYLLKTLVDIFKKYRDTQVNKFYLLTAKSVFHFKRHEGKHILLITSSGENFEKSLKFEKINYEFLQNMNESIQKEYIIITEKNLQIFWNYYINDLLKKDTPFQIIANYPFLGSSEFMPREVFNGNENRQTFEYLKDQIASQEGLTNLFVGINPNTKKKRIYNIKIQGYFTKENIEAINSTLKKKMRFEIFFNDFKGTQKYTEMLLQWKKTKDVSIQSDC